MWLALSTMTVTGESDKEIKSMDFTPCSFLLLFRKYFFMTASVNGKLNQNTDLTLVNCVSWESDNTISKIGNRVFVTLGVQITSEQSSGSLIIASIARTYYPKTTYVRANAAGGTNGDNHMLYINKSNGVVILNLSTERYYSASFSYLAN